MAEPAIATKTPNDVVKLSRFDFIEVVFANIRKYS